MIIGLDASLYSVSAAVVSYKGEVLVDETVMINHNHNHYWKDAPS